MLHMYILSILNDNINEINDKFIKYMYMYACMIFNQDF